MLSIIKKTLSKSLQWKQIEAMSGRYKPKKITQTRESLQPRLKRKMLNDLKRKCRQGDKVGVNMILDHQFYESINNKPEVYEILRWKNSVDYYFRHYQGILMNLQNEEILASGYSNKQMNNLSKLLINILTNHKKLPKSHKKQSNSIFHIYINSLCDIITGELENSTAKMLELINMPMVSLIKNKEISQQQLKNFEQQNRILNSNNISVLNLKQQIFFNLLIFSMIKDSEDNNSKPIIKTKPLQLYRKIKNNSKLTLNDFMLEDFQAFLNIWISAKNDSPMEWTDLTAQQAAPYYKYIYLLAENSYINKQISKSNNILSYLPSDYPLRHFLQVSQLFDSNNFLQMRQKFDEITIKKEQNLNQFYKNPEFDIVYYKILELMKKMESKISNNKQQHKEMVEELDQLIITYKYETGIKDLDSKGIPYYYLIIPFDMFLVDDNFYDLFN